MKLGMKGPARILVALAPLLALSALVWYWQQAREMVYGAIREHAKTQALTALSGYHTRTSAHFKVYYGDVDQDVAELILDTAETVYKPVVDRVGYRPPAPVPIIVYPNREALRHAFGWGNGESALGVYWGGTIRLLSPNAWIIRPSSREQRLAFQKLNPLAHEFTHYTLDYLTSGNYPRWFTEGLAQYVEYNVTGYLWIEPESTLRQRLYTLQELQGEFDRLKNQPLAYRQSYLLFRYMATTYGDERLSDLIGSLARGEPFAHAVQRVLGLPLPQVYDRWQAWVNANLERLDPEE